MGGRAAEFRSGSQPTSVVPILLGALLLVAAAPAKADLESPSFTLRGSHAATSAGGLSSASFSGGGALAPQPIGVGGVAASPGDLSTVEPGFFPILRGEPLTLDLDADGVAWYLDDDDDGDGLLDAVETNSGLFLSASDTGTDSLIADTDGDGADDGFEVVAASDPNDPSSTPGGSSVPTAGLFARMFIALGTAGAAISSLRVRGRVQDDEYENRRRS